MIHLGDITKIDGHKVFPVDCLVGGSPCQDLSIAGKREGLAGARSGLFMDQIRLVKEMRDEDRRNGRTAQSVRPRWLVWENVPGAFSSNKGDDFRAVLEEVCRINDEAVTIPRPEKGKWTNTGCIIGDGFSVAWRVFDAQAWGVPQRRRRICLLADLNGYRAADILFERAEHFGRAERTESDQAESDFGMGCRSQVQSVSQGLYGNHPQSQKEKEEASTDAERCSDVCHSRKTSGEACRAPHEAFTMQDRCGKPGGGKGPLVQIEKSATLSCNNNQILVAEEPLFFDTSHADDVVRADDKVSPIEARDFKGGKNVCISMAQIAKGDGAFGGDKAFAIVGDHENRPTDMTNLVIYDNLNPDVAGTLDASYYKGCGMRGGIEREVVVALDRAAYNQGKNAKFDFFAEESQFSPPIIAKGPCAVCYETVALEGNGQRPSHKGDGYKVSDQSYTLNTTEVHGVAYETYQNCTGTLMANSHPGSYCGQDAYNDMLVTGVKAVDAWNGNETDEVNGTLQSSCDHNCHSNNVVRYRKIVRRLTELECERLQGYPDDWTLIPDFTDSKGKKKSASASARYKALGNSIALPSWMWVMKRISATYERPATLASLFDGIGGFPLIWEQINGKGTCLWCSEIEDFPNAVTEYRFG